MAQHQGGKGNYLEDPERGLEAYRQEARRGRAATSRNDPQRASEAGKKVASAAYGGTDNRAVEGTMRSREAIPPFFMPRMRKETDERAEQRAAQPGGPAPTPSTVATATLSWNSWRPIAGTPPERP